jgi:hypothetical protein
MLPMLEVSLLVALVKGVPSLISRGAQGMLQQQASDMKCAKGVVVVADKEP